MASLYLSETIKHINIKNIKIFDWFMKLKKIMLPSLHRRLRVKKDNGANNRTMQVARKKIACRGIKIKDIFSFVEKTYEPGGEKSYFCRAKKENISSFKIRK